MPSKLALQINRYSTISGAGITCIVHHKHMNKHISHPKKPQTRFEDIPEFDWNTFNINFQIFIIL